MHPCVSCVPVDLYVLSLRCYRLVLRPVKAMLDRNFRCTVTEYVLAPCSMRKPRAKSVYASRARVHTEQDDLWLVQPVVACSAELTVVLCLFSLDAGLEAPLISFLGWIVSNCLPSRVDVDVQKAFHRTNYASRQTYTTAPELTAGVALPRSRS